MPCLLFAATAQRRIKEGQHDPFPIHFDAPVGTVERFSELTGITLRIVENYVRAGRLPIMPKLVDITDGQHLSSSFYHPTDYRHSQAFASEQRSNGADGLKYRSVRLAGHGCFVLLRPRLITKIGQAKHFDYCWNGSAIANVLAIQLHG